MSDHDSYYSIPAGDARMSTTNIARNRDALRASPLELHSNDNAHELFASGESPGSPCSTPRTPLTAVEKIHLLPISEEAPKSWVFACLTEFMKHGTPVRQYMYVRVKRPAKESKGIRKGESGENKDKENVVYTYIVVACLPHSGVVTSSTVVFTTGSPLKPLKRVQLLALVHPNSAYARRAGVSSYSDALQRGVVGGGSSTCRERNSSNTRRGEEQGSSESTSALVATESGSNSNTAAGSGVQRRQLGSPFDWGEVRGATEGQQRRTRPVREYSRAEEVIAAVLDESGSGESDEEEEDGSLGEGGAAFRLSDVPVAEGCTSESAANTEDPQQQQRQQQQQQRTLQLNFNFSSSSLGDVMVSRDGSAVRNLSEGVLFHEFVAPYFRARSASLSAPSTSTKEGEEEEISRDTAVVVFPGKKLVIKDLTFVVWATDPDNGPGFVRKDTAMYISVDPWGEYRRVHILPFADTLPTTYSFRLFEDYLQPFLKEQPWRLIRKGDIFTFSNLLTLRGVEFKVIATEPSSIPVARVGPETVVHFEGSLNPSLIDILPPEILARVRRLPARVQPFAIVAAAQTLDPQLLLRVLPSGNFRGNRRGIDEGLEAAVERQLVGPFCLSEYQRKYAHLCMRKSKEDMQSKRRENETSASPDSRQRNMVPVGSKMTSTETENANASVDANISVDASADANGDASELECPSCTVCTLQLQEGTESVTLTCGHAFHWGCARAWLRCSATCPNCRAEVVLPREDKEDAGGNSEENAGNAALGFVRNALADFFSV